MILPVNIVDALRMVNVAHYVLIMRVTSNVHVFTLLIIVVN